MAWRPSGLPGGLAVLWAPFKRGVLLFAEASRRALSLPRSLSPGADKTNNITMPRSYGTIQKHETSLGSLMGKGYWRVPIKALERAFGGIVLRS